MVDDIRQIGDGAGEFPAVDGLRGFAGVLEGDAEVGAARAGGFGGLEVGGCVADLERGEVVSMPVMEEMGRELRGMAAGRWSCRSYGVGIPDTP